MSLHAAAKHLASKGRDGDTELVHMTKDEIRSLQGLALAAGGSLSINPDTGLVEASFLKRMLPMIAGVGLAATGLGPLAAAGMVGGFETLRTGDLGRGLMAGLGAYGGAGLAGSLSSAGAAAGDVATSGVTNSSPIAENVAQRSANIKDLFQVQNATPIPGAAVPGSVAGPTITSGITPQAPITMANMGAGAKQVMSSPEAFGTFAKGNMMNIGAAAAPAVAEAAFQPQPMPGMPQDDEMYKDAPYRYRLSPNFQGFTPRQPQPYYRPVGLGYAAGGDIQMMPNGGLAEIQGARDGYGALMTSDGNIPQMATGGMTMGQGIAKDTDEDTASLGAYDAAKKRLEKIGKASNVKMTPMPKTSVGGLGQIKMASGGLGGYSDGGRMLKGPGDGMSDDIPAVIGNKQPARLADGEFVVPADVVSHLGNGSTDAGARKLYKMMDKVRVARTGKKKQAPAVKTDKFIPRG